MTTWRHTVVAACIMGLLAAAMVWYLQTDSRERLAKQFQEYLSKVNDFRSEFPEPPAQ